MLVLAGMRPLCSWFLIMDAISSLEVVPFHFHNLCRNTCWQRQSRCLAVPPAVRQGGRGCLGRRNQHYLLGQSSPELAGPLGCSSTVQVPGLAKPFPSAQKVTFLVYSTDSCPDKLSSLKKCPGPWLCRSFQLIEAAEVKSPPKARLCFRGAL